MVKKKNYVVLFSMTTFLVFMIDQWLKYLVFLYQPVWKKGFLSIHFVTNSGAGFGILQGKTVWLGMISLLVVLMMIYFYKQIPREKIAQVLFGLFLGGVL